jgi:hypothetical protein
MLADYCPYNQELAYKNSNRDSRCYFTENQPPRNDDSNEILLIIFSCFFLKRSKIMFWKNIHRIRNVLIMDLYGNNILINVVENVGLIHK